MSRGIRTIMLTAGAAALLAAQPATASAATTAPRVDPLVTLSVFGTAQSRAAVCAGSTAAAAAAATAMQSPAPGCVFPVTAAPPPPAVGQAVPPPMAPVAGPGIGTLPLLLGLAAIVGLAALLLSSGDDGDGDITPISP